MTPNVTTQSLTPEERKALKDEIRREVIRELIRRQERERQARQMVGRALDQETPLTGVLSGFEMSNLRQAVLALIRIAWKVERVTEIDPEDEEAVTRFVERIYDLLSLYRVFPDPV